MDKPVRPGRTGVMGAILAVLLVIFFVALYKLQIVEGRAYYEESRNNVATAQRVVAARGNILDRYGRVLVSNTSINNIVLNAEALLAQDDPNAAILQMVHAVQSCGDTYTDTLPITKKPPFEYTRMNELQRTLLNAYLESVDLPQDASAVELMSVFRDKFKINNNYSAEDMRTIAGIRYELKVRYVTPTADYVFVEDASMDLIAALMEQNVRGFEVAVSFKRQYNTSLAPHILGQTGLMTASEYQTYGALGYSMDATVGKSGAEYAFESQLHGKDGTAIVTRNAAGTITNTSYTTEPEPGNNVSLTIDLDLQGATEKALATGIENMRQNADDPEGTKVGTGGAVVAVEVKTGEPLAMASYPSYDLQRAMSDSDYASELNHDDTHRPLINRALDGAYEPGSTFKPCTAIAGLTEGVLTTNTYFNCEGVFTKYEDTGYAPHCWVYPGSHGTDNVTDALRDSCNVFFFTVGDSLKIETLGKYAAAFGLGQHTGIEIPESTGQMASEELKKAREGAAWYKGDTLQASIGQSLSLFTPMQLAEYCATIANGGVRHSASIMKTVRSYDYSTEIASAQHEVMSTVDSPDYNWKAVQQGMYLVANDPQGSAYSTFGGYTPLVAAKTGTAQVGENQVNNAIFICYAPYDDPQIAVAVVVEHGTSGASIASIARDVLDAYFTEKTLSTAVETELALLQ